MRKEWMTLATKPVPRYTSYPTAAQFQDDIPDTLTEQWISSIGPNEPISVYVHVPFCEQLCWYCGCHTTVPNGYTRIGRFVDMLLEEIKLWKAKLPEHGGGVHLHFGGGTPNALNADDMLRVLDALREAFCIQDHAEISVELDPRTLGPDMIHALAAGGVTRASLGVQDFNRTVQEAINRVQPFLLVEGAVEALRKAEINAINFDLLYGLPHQTTESVAKSAELAASLNPDRISAFGYAHVPWFAKHQRAIDERHLPGSEARFAQYHALGETLVACGYTQIGLDHFAKEDDELSLALSKGQLHRNFQGYTTRGDLDLLGLGVSSISAVYNMYGQNPKTLNDYYAALDKPANLTTKGVLLNRDDMLRRQVIMQLMCNLNLAICDIESEWEIDFNAYFADAIAALYPFIDDGLVSVTAQHIKVAPQARLLIRIISMSFDAYLAREVHQRRYSRVI